jgi:hypothetical protein
MSETKLTKVQPHSVWAFFLSVVYSSLAGFHIGCSKCIVYRERERRVCSLLEPFSVFWVYSSSGPAFSMKPVLTYSSEDVLGGKDK